MSKITKLIAQAIMELQNIHKAVVGVDKRVEAVEQAIAPRTITGARIKDGTITLASMQATAVEAAITGNVPKIQSAMVRCHDLPVLTSKGMDEDIERAAARVSYPQTVKVEDCEQGDAAVKAAFSAALGNSINGAADGAQSEALMALASILRDSGLGASGGSELVRRAELKDNPSLVTAALNFSNLLTPLSVLGLLDALAQARTAAAEANAHLDAAVQLHQDLAEQLTEAQKPIMVTRAMKRAIRAYLATNPDDADKAVDAFKD